jgi:hypothetical protein
MEGYQFIPINRLFGPIRPFTKYEFMSNFVRVKLSAQNYCVLTIHQRNTETDSWVEKLYVNKDLDNYKVYFNLDGKLFSLMTNHIQGSTSSWYEVFRFNFDNYLMTHHIPMEKEW